VSLQTGGAVALTDIVSRGVVVHWFEGVAVLQEICTALASQPAGLAPPDLGSAWISADGMMAVRPGSPGEAPVLRLGRLLSDLIAQDPQVPPPLRLCISQATASPPMFSSVEELSSSLGYFERPDRRALVRAVHERYLLTPAAQTAPVRLVADSRTETKGRQDPKQRRRSAGSIVRYLVLAAGTAAVCAAVLMGREGLPEAVNLEALTLALNLEGLNLKGLNPWTQADVESPATAAAARGPAIARTRANGSPARISAGMASADARTESNPHLLLLESARVAHVDGGPWLDLPSAIGAASPGEAGSGIVAFESVTVFADETIYSSADARVEPPVMSYPQLPQVPPDFTDADRVNALEVVIGEDGLVQSVRLLSAPRRLTDMMLLSAAGNWRFTPATLDGVSVPYRTAIRWAVPQP